MRSRQANIDRRFARALKDLSRESNERLRSLLRVVRYELSPRDDIVERVAERFPPGSVPLAVAAPEGRPIAEMAEVSLRLASAGFDVMPHLPARAFESETEVGHVVARFRRRGIKRALVVGGDSEAHGPFESAAGLLRSLREGSDQPFELGVAGHPEGNPHIADPTGVLVAKQELAHFVVTQLTFDVASLGKWLGEIRLRHIDLPVHVSIPGLVAAQRLRRTAESLGVGASRVRLPEYGDYSPGDLVIGLSELPLEKLRVAGLHVVTFNEVEAVERWRQLTYDALFRTER